MSWKHEFDQDFEVPSELEDLVSKGLLEDQSWHNDVCPSFRCPATDRAVYVDHPEPAQRECQGPRYFVQQYEDGMVTEGEPLYTGEDLKAALATMGLTA